MEGNLALAAANMADNNQNQTVNVHKKNKRFSLFKAAMVMIQNPRNEKTKPVKVAHNYSDDKWKKLVGSMRPLHLQDSQSPPPQNPAVAQAIKIPTGKRSEIDELFPISPSSTSSWGTMSQFASTNNLQEVAGTGTMSQSSSASNLQELAGGASTMSQYGSATNLRDLDVEEEDESDKVLENCEADVMIDAKAEEFIAQFYEQMRRQHKGKPRQ